jgi:drug/metabolite transporter (DMT)-like permease
LVIGGIAVMAVSFFALLGLLSISDLSFAIPATAASYLLETVLAKLILKEDVRWQRWCGPAFAALKDPSGRPRRCNPICAGPRGPMAL